MTLLYSVLVLVTSLGLSYAETARSTVPETVNVIIDLVTVGGGVGPVYLAEISVGNPPQKVQVQVDTGSSDLWVFSDKVDCNVENGCIGGSYDNNASSTFEPGMSEQFEWAYGDGHNGTGFYAQDDVTIGGATLKNLTFGVTTRVEGGQQPLYGIMGLGFASNEFIVNQENNPKAAYPNVPAAMALQGLTEAPVFSVYLNDDKSKGSLLFGGVDSDKSTGPSVSFDIIGSDGQYSQYYVNLTALGVTTSNGTYWPNNASVTGPAFLDTGSPKAFLPADAAFPVMEAVGASYDPNLSQSVIACSAANSDAKNTVDFVISNGNGGDNNEDTSLKVSVPVAQLVYPWPGTGAPTIDGEPGCSFGVSPGPDGFMVLGDGFLRGVYATFDQEKHTVTLAEAVLGQSPSEGDVTEQDD